MTYTNHATARARTRAGISLLASTLCVAGALSPITAHADEAVDNQDSLSTSMSASVGDGSTALSSVGSSTSSEGETMEKARAVEILAHGVTTKQQRIDCVGAPMTGDIVPLPQPVPPRNACPSTPISEADVDAALTAAGKDLSILVQAYFDSQKSRVRLAKGDAGAGTFIGLLLRALTAGSS